MPNVSVIIPTYNRALYVTKAIDSVLAQTYKDYEIIVVDDGSTDNTKNVLEPYLGRINYMYQENAGVSAARNTGIKSAKGQWIAFLDSDDEWLPEKLACHLEGIRKNSKVCLHVVNALLKNEYAEDADFFRFANFSNHMKSDSCRIERPLVYQIKYGFAKIQCVMIRQASLMNVGLFDTRLTLYEDQDLICRLATQGAWGLCNKILVHVIRRDEAPKLNLSQQRTSRPFYHYECLLYIFTKLKLNEGLQSSERDFIQKYLSNEIFNLGLAQLKAGMKREGLANVRRSFLDNPSLKSFAKYAIVRSFGSRAGRLIKKPRYLLKKWNRRSNFLPPRRFA